MSRFSGPQSSGAARDLRAEAEQRQREEAARLTAIALKHPAEPVRPLTDDEINGLIAAVNGLTIAHLLDDLTRFGYKPGRTTS